MTVNALPVGWRLATGNGQPLDNRGWSRSGHAAVCVASIVAALLGYGIGDIFDSATGAFFDTFAAGALLVMLTDSMIPEAFEQGKKEAGLAFTLGFGVALALTIAQL